MRFSRYLIIPLVIIAVVCYIPIYKDIEGPYMYFIGVALILAAAIFMMSPQIDWWWALRHPPAMDPREERMIGAFLPFYRNLGASERKRFRDRVMLWNMARDYKGINPLENAPEEVQAVVGAYAVMMTFGKEKYLLEYFSTIVVYAHAFPSPRYKILHSAETDFEDGAFIFDMERLMLATVPGKKSYNNAVHELAKGFMHQEGEPEIPDLTPEDIQKLEEIRGYGKDFVHRYMGFLIRDGIEKQLAEKGEISEERINGAIDMKHVAVEHFFMAPANFKRLLPERYDAYVKYFNLDPLGGETPVQYINLIGENPLAG